VGAGNKADITAGGCRMSLGLKRILRSSKWNAVIITLVVAGIAAVFEKVEIDQVIRLAEILVGLGIFGTAFEDGLEKAKGTFKGYSGTDK